jgi:hypothetical protein
MTWLVDNFQILSILLGISALAFGAAWWLHRRRQFAIGAAAAVVILVLLWLLTRFIVTDRQQLALNVYAMADAVVAGKSHALVQLLTGDFEFQGHKAPELAAAVVKAAKQYQVNDIHISGIDVEDLTATAAKVFFRATAHARGDDRPYMVACRATFVKEGTAWKLKQAKFFNPVGNQEINLPVP